MEIFWLVLLMPLRYNLEGSWKGFGRDLCEAALMPLCYNVEGIWKGFGWDLVGGSTDAIVV